MKYINTFVVLYSIAGCVAFLKGLFQKNEMLILLGLVIIGIASVSASIKHLDKKFSHKFIGNNLETFNNKTSNKYIQHCQGGAAIAV